MSSRCLCASGYSTGVGEIEDRFGVSSEIGTLGLSLYLVSLSISFMLSTPLTKVLDALLRSLDLQPVRIL
jgi:hypothetical protein